MAGINLQPEVLDLSLYAGDGCDFRFSCKNKAGAPVDITGAVRAHVRLDRVNNNPPVAEFTVDLVDAYLGIIMISLTGEQTQELVEPSGKFVGVWDLEWDAVDKEPRTLCQGKLECVADVTRG